MVHLDLETYSDVDLGDCGVYRYVEGDFHILLCAYAFDDDPVQIVDLAQGESFPPELTEAILSDDVIKAAWNAQFERTCLSKFFGRQLAPDSWRCSMVHAASLSLPLKLKNAALALNTEDKKDAAGDRLIKYFSVPCKPTKSNGGRTRNLPEHDPESWQKFKEYCLQDVRTERAIGKILEKFPLSDREWEFYHLDQRINDRGVLIDTELVNQAIRCDAEQSEEMYKRACEITGLENPNSVVQLKAWLEGQGVNVPSLGKKDVSALLENASGDVLEMLKLRLQMSKSSVKKYQAAERCACKDGRARGLFQFSGANRTQRWCLAEGSPVLVKTKEGQILNKAIEDVEITDMVFDGDNWVRHEGVVYSGDKAVISYDGITATPDHIVYINNEKKMKLGEAMAGGVKLWNLA